MQTNIQRSVQTTASMIEHRQGTSCGTITIEGAPDTGDDQPANGGGDQPTNGDDQPQDGDQPAEEGEGDLLILGGAAALGLLLVVLAG